MKEQVFHDVEDFLDLDEQAFQRMLPDLVEWHRLSRQTLLHAQQVGLEGKVHFPNFIWLDDGNTGNCKWVRLKMMENGS